MAGKASFDFDLCDRFIGVTLDRFSAGKRDRVEAIGDIAHLIAIFVNDTGSDPAAYMQATIDDPEI